jgi:hypothetical protein
MIGNNNIEPDRNTSAFSKTIDEEEQLKEAKICDSFDLILKNQSQIIDRIECLQRTIAAMCAAYHDFKSEYLEDVAEIKTELLTLRLGLQRTCLTK